MRSRKQIRLRGHDYSLPGAYFVTVCTKDRMELFGEIVDGEMTRNEFGNIVQSCWDDLPSHYPHVQLDAFVVMPDHVHGIIMIMDDDMDPVGAGLRPAPTGSHAPTGIHGETQRHPLPEIVRAFKSFSARHINETRNTPGTPVWQRGYYDHIIRNEQSFNRIVDYIRTNPQHWHCDKENPNCEGADNFDPWLTEEKKQRIAEEKDL